MYFYFYEFHHILSSDFIKDLIKNNKKQQLCGKHPYLLNILRKFIPKNHKISNVKQSWSSHILTVFQR